MTRALRNPQSLPSLVEQKERELKRGEKTGRQSLLSKQIDILIISGEKTNKEKEGTTQKQKTRAEN